MKNKAIVFIAFFLLSACSINYPCNTWSLVARERVADEFIFSVFKDLIPSYEVEKEKKQLFLEASKILSFIGRKKMNSCSVDGDRVDIGHRGSKYTFIVSCAEKVKLMAKYIRFIILVMGLKTLCNEKIIEIRAIIGGFAKNKIKLTSLE